MILIYDVVWKSLSTRFIIHILSVKVSCTIIVELGKKAIIYENVEVVITHASVIRQINVNITFSSDNAWYAYIDHTFIDNVLIAFLSVYGYIRSILKFYSILNSIL